MLGANTRKGYATSVGRQSRQRLCSELSLRQGFGRRPKRLYGALAPPGLWPGFPLVKIPALKSAEWSRTKLDIPGGKPGAPEGVAFLFSSAFAE